MPPKKIGRKPPLSIIWLMVFIEIGPSTPSIQPDPDPVEQVGGVHVHHHGGWHAAHGRGAGVLGDLGEDAAEDVGAFLPAGALVDDLTGHEFAGLDALLLLRGRERGGGAGGLVGVEQGLDDALELRRHPTAQRVQARRVSLPNEKVDLASRTASFGASAVGVQERPPLQGHARQGIDGVDEPVRVAAAGPTGPVQTASRGSVVGGRRRGRGCGRRSTRSHFPPGRLRRRRRRPGSRRTGRAPCSRPGPSRWSPPHRRRAHRRAAPRRPRGTPAPTPCRPAPAGRPSHPAPPVVSSPAPTRRSTGSAGRSGASTPNRQAMRLPAQPGPGPVPDHGRGADPGRVHRPAGALHHLGERDHLRVAERVDVDGLHHRPHRARGVIQEPAVSRRRPRCERAAPRAARPDPATPAAPRSGRCRGWPGWVPREPRARASAGAACGWRRIQGRRHQCRTQRRCCRTQASGIRAGGIRRRSGQGGVPVMEIRTGGRSSRRCGGA